MGSSVVFSRVSAAFLAVLMCTGIAVAQQAAGATARLPDPKFDRILPARGDIGLGLSMEPFLQYLGQLFTPGNNAPVFSNGTNNELTARYFLSPTSAIRGRLRIGYLSQTTRADVLDAAQPLNAVPLEDSYNRQQTNIVVGGGIERRRGYGRLQGLYGAELSAGFSMATDRYTYGNALNSQAAMDNSTYFSGVLAPSRFSTREGYSARLTKAKQAPIVTLGIRGFLGAEYYFTPKMSIGGEIGWQFLLRSAGTVTTTGEAWNSDTEEAVDAQPTKVQQTPNLLLFDSQPVGTLTLNLFF